MAIPLRNTISGTDAVVQPLRADTFCTSSLSDSAFVGAFQLAARCHILH
jgi:hypothetical protein